MKVDRFDEGDGVTMVRVSHAEAMKIIKGLAAQILNNDPNQERTEFYDVAGNIGGYFTIAVMPRPKEAIRPWRLLEEKPKKAGKRKKRRPQ